VGNDLTGRITIIDTGFEDENFLPGDLRPAKTTDQLFGFAAEHTAGNDLDPSDILGSLLLGDFHNLTRTVR
jgi:hypothetical protein